MWPYLRGQHSRSPLPFELRGPQNKRIALATSRNAHMTGQRQIRVVQSVARQWRQRVRPAKGPTPPSSWNARSTPSAALATHVE